jgi:hypothetical protein
MNNDREKLIEMFRRANVNFKLNGDGSLDVEANFAGYCATFYFNEDGSLKTIGAFDS